MGSGATRARLLLAGQMSGHKSQAMSAFGSGNLLNLCSHQTDCVSVDLHQQRLKWVRTPVALRPYLRPRAQAKKSRAVIQGSRETGGRRPSVVVGRRRLADRFRRRGAGRRRRGMRAIDPVAVGDDRLLSGNPIETLSAMGSGRSIEGEDFSSAADRPA
jgi:hypothetical protein